MENILSVFIDESSVFGEFSEKAPYYMVFHDQRINISEEISALDRHINELGFPPHAVHMGPLIRREQIYLQYDDEASRASLINTMYHFVRRELLALKSSEGEFTVSEKRFFDSPHRFMKNRYKLIAKKKL